MALSGWRPCEWNRCLTRLGVTGFYFNSSSCLILRIVGGKREIAEFYNKSEAVSLKLGPSSLALIQYALNTHSQCHVLWLRNIDRERPFFFRVPASNCVTVWRAEHQQGAFRLRSQKGRRHYWQHSYGVPFGLDKGGMWLYRSCCFFFFSFKLPPGVATQ